jgi:hypothetical protein
VLGLLFNVIVSKLPFICFNSAENDYFKVFPERKRNEEPKEEDNVYELGTGGFDISS